MRYYLGIDQGTTLTTAVLTDEEWNVIGKGSREHRQIYPQPGWVEHSPEEIYSCFEAAAGDAIRSAGADPRDVAALGFDHQGETCLIWDRFTGEPLYNAIVWRDRRTADFAESLKNDASVCSRIFSTTGLLPDSYHSATKLRWILDNVSGAREKLTEGRLLAGTLNTWLIWKLTGGEVFVTDGCSGGRTMLMDMRTTSWVPWLFDLIGIPEELLPPILDCNTIYGYTRPDRFLGISIPIAGCVTDSNAGIIGGGGTDAGTLTTSYGTGAFLGLITGSEYVEPKGSLNASVCWQMSGERSFRLMAACYVAGAAVKWLRDGLGMISAPSESEELARSVPDSAGVFFVPAFSGMATPYWDQYARGAFLGLTAAADKRHLVRAVLESIAYQTAGCFRVMQEQYSRPIDRMYANGGMTDNDFLMQFQADMIGVPVLTPSEKETAAYGSAILAGVTTGVLNGLSDAKDRIKIRRIFEPSISDDEREERFARWERAVSRCLNWIEH